VPFSSVTTLIPPFALAAVILAAGRSSRMGRPKLLLPWGETSVIGHLIQQWQSLKTARLVVVCAEGDRALLAELDRLNFPAASRVLNPAPETGMFGSIQRAGRAPGWSESLTHWGIVLGDQPHLRTDALRGLLHFASTHPRQVSQPSRRGHGRHPVILPRELFSRLDLSTAGSLKEFLQEQKAETSVFEVEDAAFDLDLDHPADYEKARRLYAG